MAELRLLATDLRYLGNADDVGYTRDLDAAIATCRSAGHCRAGYGLVADEAGRLRDMGRLK